MTGNAITISRRRMLVLGGTLAGASLLSLKSAGAAGGELVYIDGAGVDVLDPALTVSRTAETVLALLFNRLTRWKDTSLSGIEGDLAESWQISPDGLAWTFKLKSGITFHDGTPFNAEGVKFNLDRLRDPKFGSPSRSVFAPISTVEVVDENTVTLKTETPYASLLEGLAEFSASMNSPAAVTRWGRDYGRNPVGTGPYALGDWSPGEQVEVVRAKGPGGAAAHFDRIIIRAIPESGARLVEMETGNADIVSLIPPEGAPRLQNRPDVRLEVLPSTLQVFMVLNPKRAPFDNPKLRHALNYAIDRKAIIEKILGGFAGVPDSYLTTGCQAYTPLEAHPYDPERAKKIFAEAYPGGQTEPIVIWTPQGRYLKDKEAAEAVQGYLNAIGLKTEFKVFEWAAFLQGVSRPQPGKGNGFGSDACHMYLIGTSIPVADWRFDRWYGTGKGLNWSGFSSAKVDELIAKGRTTMDQAARAAIYKELAGLLWNTEVPAISLYNQKQLIGLGKRVKSFEAYSYEVPILDGVRTG